MMQQFSSWKAAFYRSLPLKPAANNNPNSAELALNLNATAEGKGFADSFRKSVQSGSTAIAAHFTDSYSLISTSLETLDEPSISAGNFLSLRATSQKTEKLAYFLETRDAPVEQHLRIHDVRALMQNAIIRLTEEPGKRLPLTQLSNEELTKACGLQFEKEVLLLEIMQDARQLCCDMSQQLESSPIIVPSLQMNGLKHASSIDVVMNDSSSKQSNDHSEIDGRAPNLNELVLHPSNYSASYRNRILSASASCGLVNVPASIPPSDTHSQVLSVRGLIESGIALLTPTTNNVVLSLSLDELQGLHHLQIENEAKLLKIIKEAYELCNGPITSVIDDLQTNSKDQQANQSRTSRSLSANQIAQLRALATDNVNGVILVVDDALSQLKMVLNKLEKGMKLSLSLTEIPKTNHLKSIKKAWADEELVIEQFGLWAIVCAADGDIALNVVKECQLKALITDQQMPVMDGLELIKQVRALEIAQSRTPINIVLNTALSRAEMTQKQLILDDSLNVTYWYKSTPPSAIDGLYRQFLDSIDFQHDPIVVAENSVQASFPSC